jgi:hypothetical protein
VPYGVLPVDTTRKPLSCERVKANREHPLNKGLVAEWLFNEYAGGAARSIDNRYAAVLGGTATLRYSEANMGPVLNLASTDGYAEETVSLVKEYPFTMGVWCRLADTGTIQVLFQVGRSDASNVYYRIATNALGRPTLTARNTSSKVLTANKVIDTDGAWHQVVGVFIHETDRVLYVDGVVDGGADLASVTYNTLVDRYSIGRNGGSAPDSYVTGSIGSAMFYARALLAHEVAQLYSYPYGTPNNPRLI